MTKIFGISDLPVAKPFPSFDFGEMNLVGKTVESVKTNITKNDVFVKKNIPQKKYLKQFFSRIKH